MGKAKVLFLCTGNSARSQMAEAFLRKYAGDRFEVYSAGMEPRGINPHTVRAMEEVDLSLNGHRSKPLTEYMGKVDFDYLITVCDDAAKNCPIWLWKGQRVHIGFPDPAKTDEMADFRKMRDGIERQIILLLETYED